RSQRGVQMARITLRLTDALHRRLVAASCPSGVSLNQLIASILSTASENGQLERHGDDPLLERAKHLRLILGDLVGAIDPDELPPTAGSDIDAVPIEEFRPSLPHLHPRLSAAVSDEREDRP